MTSQGLERRLRITYKTEHDGFSIPSHPYPNLNTATLST